jgi:anti-sigma factor RsiW
MKHETETSQCQRADDLLAYLYDEANEAERLDFTRHLEACRPCQTELAAFQGVRQDMAAWRGEILSAAPARLVTDYAPAPQPSLAAAWAALREVFTLSPLWLRGATAFAGLAVAGLLVFALTRGNAPANVAAMPANTTVTGLTEEEAQRRAAAAAQREREQLEAQHAQELAALKTQNADAGQRLAALQSELEKAQNNAPATRIIKVRVPVPTPQRNVTVANNGHKPAPRRAPQRVNGANEEEITASLSEVMFGGAGSRR